MKRPRPSSQVTGRALLIFAGAGALAACSAGEGDAEAGAPSCNMVEGQPLVAGTATESYLGIAESQRRAIVQLVDGSGATMATCTGTFVSPTWVVSAAHCLAIPSLAIAIQAGDGGPSALVPVARAVQHDSRDIALLEVDFGSAAARIDDEPMGDSGGVATVSELGVVPIVASSGEPTLTSGTPVELAGFGIDEEGTSHGLTFVVESVVDVETTRVNVSGFGTSGACEGDSGGPLLLRSKGRVAVRGVLSTGVASCRGIDHYVRLDDMTEWITGVAGDFTADVADCGTITERGRCLYGAAVYCAEGALHTDECDPATQCGFDAEQRSFRCVKPKLDPCSGVDAVGACRDNLALSCRDGALRGTPCAPCGTCRVDSRTGAPFCASPAE